MTMPLQRLRSGRAAPFRGGPSIPTKSFSDLAIDFTAMHPLTRSQLLLGLLFVFAGIAHFLRPDPYIGIMPPWIPAPALMVALSGVAEILGGLGVLWPRTRRIAGIWLILLLIAVFPANIQMLINGIHDAKPWWYQMGLWLRLPLQPLMVWWIVRATARRRH